MLAFTGIIIETSPLDGREISLPTDPILAFSRGLPFQLDPYQIDALQALTRGQSVLVTAPTGTGKTVIAEFAVQLALFRDLRALYTTPIKALSNQKFRDFRLRHGDQVGLMTGDLVENPSGRLLVMTTEVARNMLVQDPSTFRDVGCLVFDEVHYLADPERGTAWEESILLAPPYVPLVCLSATVANARELADWIASTGRDVALVESFERAVPLKHRYFLDGKLHPILENGAQLPAIHLPKGNAKIALPRHGGRTNMVNQAGAPGGRHGRGGPDPEGPPFPPDVVKSMAGANLLPAIYFLFSRRSVEEAAESCQKLTLLPYSERTELYRLAQERLAQLPAQDRVLDQVQRLVGLLPRGIGFHHAGLLPPLKTLVEELLASGKLKVVFATDTLALGLNVPARSVVVGEMTKFDGQSRRLLLSSEYRQLTGRAGRRGMDSVGYSILLHSPRVGLARTLEVATGDVAPLESAFRPGYSTILNLWQSPDDEDRISRLIAGSLRQFQESGRLRTLATERDEISSALGGLPIGCPLDGGPINWLAQEKGLLREQERAETRLEAAHHESAGLEAQIANWPWQYAKSRKREWVRQARQGEVVYSRKRGWGVYLGPAPTGIGQFHFGGTPLSLEGYPDLDYLPDPPLQIAPLPPGEDSAHSPLPADPITAALHALPLPDLETTAREHSSRLREANSGALFAAREKLAAAQERLNDSSLGLAGSPCRSCHLRASHRRSERQRRDYGGQLAAAERDLASARADSSRRAQRILQSLRRVLESLGYMSAGQPGPKAALLRRLFDSNSLVISEMLDWGMLADASPAEVAEVASWFAFDREGSGKALSMTERLNRMRATAESISKRVLEIERRQGVSLSSPFSPEFRGIALAWAGGADLATIAARSGLAEGDLVFALQKTIDLCKQIGVAASASRTPSLARRAAEAEKLLRRGVVDSYYCWVVSPAALEATSPSDTGSDPGSARSVASSAVGYPQGGGTRRPDVEGAGEFAIGRTRHIRPA